MKKLLISLIVLILLGGVAYAGYQWNQGQILEGPPAPDGTRIDEISEEPELSPTLNIEMPFYSQAPHANWDYPWQEACEEASILLVANLYKDLDLDLEEFNTELLRLVDWEVDYFGAYEHTSVEQTVLMMEINYGLGSVIHEDPSFEDIQTILNNGHLIVAPFAGKLLENPNFRDGGPTYHMTVIKGYDAEKQQIVTHDVGTRNGANYVYSWETIEKSLHDWHPSDMLLGDKLIIEVIPFKDVHQ